MMGQLGFGIISLNGFISMVSVHLPRVNMVEPRPR